MLQTSKIVKGLSRYDLKLLALIFMLIDHLHTYLFLDSWPQFMAFPARFVAPLFLYFLVEGFFKTRSRYNYLKRLIVAALITALGNGLINILFHNTNIRTGRMDLHAIMQGNNILITLAIIFVTMWLWDISRSKTGLSKVPWIILGVFALLVSTLFEGGIYFLPLVPIFYYYYNNKTAISIYFCAYCFLLFAKAIYGWHTSTLGNTLYNELCFDSEFMMIIFVPLLWMYNGKENNNFHGNKGFFYIFYPVHLWILRVIHFIING